MLENENIIHQQSEDEARSEQTEGSSRERPNTQPWEEMLQPGIGVVREIRNRFREQGYDVDHDNDRA